MRVNYIRQFMAKGFILVEKKAKKVHVSSQIHLKDLPLLQ